jgi:hypothetical protein
MSDAWIRIVQVWCPKNSLTSEIKEIPMQKISPFLPVDWKRLGTNYLFILVLSAFGIQVLLHIVNGILTFNSGDNPLLGIWQLALTPLLAAACYLGIRWLQIGRITIVQNWNNYIILTFGFYGLSALYQSVLQLGSFGFYGVNYSGYDRALLMLELFFIGIWSIIVLRLAANALKKTDLDFGAHRLIPLCLGAYGGYELVVAVQRIGIVTYNSTTSWSLLWVSLGMMYVFGGLIRGIISILVSVKVFSTRQLPTRSVHLTFLGFGVAGMVTSLGMVVHRWYYFTIGGRVDALLSTHVLFAICEVVSYGLIITVVSILLRGGRLKGRVSTLAIAAILLYAGIPLIRTILTGLTPLEQLLDVARWSPNAYVGWLHFPHILITIPFQIALLTVGALLYSRKWQGTEGA